MCKYILLDWIAGFVYGFEYGYLIVVIMALGYGGGVVWVGVWCMVL